MNGTKRREDFTMMRTQEVAMQLCEMEGKKEQVNIAQMNEIASLLPKFVLRNKDRMRDVIEFLFREFKEDFDLEVLVGYFNGEFDQVSLYVDKKERGGE
jgi:hypothetical protein